MTLMVFIAAVVVVSVMLSAGMSLAWLVWKRTGNSGWVDTVWTFTVGVTGIAMAASAVFVTDTSGLRAALVGTLIAVWALRLGLHIAFRTAGIQDDPRYAKLVREWGTDASARMFVLLQKQALVSIPLGVAIFLAAWNPAPAPSVFDVLGVTILLIAITGEALADYQLRTFQQEHRNTKAVCDRGLWSWSRHPNYFFQWLGWLAYPLLAIDSGGRYFWGLLALAAPACMYWLLNHVSGIPPLEAHMVETRGRSFQDYQKRTSAFFPLPPKSA